MERADLKKYDLPDVPGVYLFLQDAKKAKISRSDVRPTALRGRSRVLYVGKATSLRDRVRSYFDDDLIATRGPRIVDMVTKADRVAHETTPTVLEALVREAALIKKYMPSANTDGKDDKTFMYAVVTREDIPRVLAVRGKELDSKNKLAAFGFRGAEGTGRLQAASGKLQAVYGPFPSGTQLRDGLRLIRRIFPFYDTPRPVAFKSTHHRARVEFNKQIGQYPKVFNAREYRRTIRNVKLFLSGGGKELRKILEREMKAAAKAERFEEAALRRRELFALDHLQDVSLLKSESGVRSPESGLRIEAYDTAHLAGTNAIGVMVVVEDGAPTKNAYRTFRIRGNYGHRKSIFKINDDIASLKELISRRLAHPEWPLPKVVVVDGGRVQKNAAEAVMRDAGVAIPVVAVVKDERHRPREVIGALRAGITDADAVLANAEAHRFSLARHRRARTRALRW